MKYTITLVVVAFLSSIFLLGCDSLTEERPSQSEAKEAAYEYGYVKAYAEMSIFVRDYTDSLLIAQEKLMTELRSDMSTRELVQLGTKNGKIKGGSDMADALVKFIVEKVSEAKNVRPTD